MNHLNARQDPSDSDSDSSQLAQYTLGFDDGKINKLSEVEQYSISRIGGIPVLPPFENTLVPEKDLECLICQKPIPMLVQVYCPSDQNPYQDRVIYLFGCTEQKCQTQGSSRCVRGFKAWKFNEEYYRQLSAQQTRSSLPQTALNNQSDLGDNPFKMNTHNMFGQSFDNPFSAPPAPTQDPPPTVAESSLLENPFSNLSLGEKQSTTTTTSSAQKHNAKLVARLPTLCTPPHYLATDYEVKPKLSSSTTFKEFLDDQTQPSHPSSVPSSKKTEQSGHQSVSSKKKTASSGPSGIAPGPSGAQESYEVQAVKGVDPAFLDFQDRINWNDQSTQIIRYNPKGRALPVHSTKPAPSIPALQCGHQSRFELQLMPAVLRLFSCPIDWTTVWINDCVQDCCRPASDGGCREGWSEVQCFVQSVLD
ncbi:hypothetical protein PGTUg99_031131 [Puccinia graminis f. sp. tritici]|uniref:Programmed cell death protein 2 C-terminal domain-containing protein n=1 Tax=Puccinia graminis f. sp. tritici TaxID=56615 RepID=A0A5B0R8Z8_PUCGR|nr:hypothetical protein PGTUg99_031131 [Puccinia graminis f. sp. tritici]